MNEFKWASIFLLWTGFLLCIVFPCFIWIFVQMLGLLGLN